MCALELILDACFQPLTMVKSTRRPLQPTPFRFFPSSFNSQSKPATDRGNGILVRAESSIVHWDTEPTNTKTTQTTVSRFYENTQQQQDKDKKKHRKTRNERGSSVIVKIDKRSSKIREKKETEKRKPFSSIPTASIHLSPCS